jgi:hypothetical protein
MRILLRDLVGVIVGRNGGMRCLMKVLIQNLLSVNVGASNVRVPVQEIDLLERKTFGLWDHEVREEESDDTTSTP